MSRANSVSQSPSPSLSLFNFAALALIVLMAGLGLAYWLDANAKPRNEIVISTFTTPIVSKILVGTKIQIPVEWLQGAIGRNNQNVEFLNIALNVRFADNANATTVKLHFTPINTTQPSAQLLDNVYALRFTQQQLSQVGLIGKPLRDEDGFQNETVWYDPISPNPFVAKCINLGTQNSGANCLRSVQISPRLAVTYQFSSDQLIHWREFDAVLQPLVEKTIQQ